MGLAHYKIILAYDGTAFAGFQRQAQERTVQAEFETALRKIGWQGESILAAGRTDAGVHARGQVLSFQLDWSHSAEDLQNALNFYLPQDMALRSVNKVSVDFHPRFDAKSRRYSYQIFSNAVRDPLRERYAWRVWPPVDAKRIERASKLFIGKKDFKVFGSPPVKNGTTIREVFKASWTSFGDALRFEIAANAFLYHMARRITFVLVAVGQGSLEESLVEKSFENNKLELPGLAPAAGLVLEEVVY